MLPTKSARSVTEKKIELRVFIIINGAFSLSLLVSLLSSFRLLGVLNFFKHEKNGKIKFSETVLSGHFVLCDQPPPPKSFSFDILYKTKPY